MTKIVVIAVVAILIAAAAGCAIGPGYVLIERAFNNTGGSSLFEANTSIDGFGHANLYNEAKSFEPCSSVNVYEKVELGDPGCYSGGCTELEKTVAVNWEKSAVFGTEDTVVNGWMDEDSTWYTDPDVKSTGNMYEHVKVDKFVAPTPVIPPIPPCPWCP
jgi:hypothetical protein